MAHMTMQQSNPPELVQLQPMFVPLCEPYPWYEPHIAAFPSKYRDRYAELLSDEGIELVS